MSILSELSEKLQKGRVNEVASLVEQAIGQGLSAKEILDSGLLDGMNVIGEKFKNNEVYIPEVMLAARAMNAGAALLRPLLESSGVKAVGRVCIGTVKGDRHDIGKNLVRMMMEGKGLEVIDLGTGVAPERFLAAAREHDCRIVACSALLTTTMAVMKDVVELFISEGVRDRYRIMVGGAPVTEDFCRQIGADCYTPDAASAAEAAVRLCMSA